MSSPTPNPLSPQNWGIGVVTTADLTDATPAAVWGHSADRGAADPLAAQVYVEAVE